MDLSEAFDKLVRQVVFGVSEARGNTDMIIDTLVRSGVEHISNMVGRLHDQIEPEGKCALSVHAQVMCMLRVSLFML